MPSRVGYIKKLYEDGFVRVVDEGTNQEYFGRLAIGSGGMVMFSVTDERPITVGDEGVKANEREALANTKEVEPEVNKTKVTVKAS